MAIDPATGAVIPEATPFTMQATAAPTGVMPTNAPPRVPDAFHGVNIANIIQALQQTRPELYARLMSGPLAAQFGLAPGGAPAAPALPMHPAMPQQSMMPQQAPHMMPPRIVGPAPQAPVMTPPIMQGMPGQQQQQGWGGGWGGGIRDPRQATPSQTPGY